MSKLTPVFPSPDSPMQARRSNAVSHSASAASSSAAPRRSWNAHFRAAAAKVDGLPVGFRFHDLRGTGATLAAQSGAGLRELMGRLGHSSPRAALIYQHATAERDRQIAERLHDLAVLLAGTERT
jgi:integrase